MFERVRLTRLFQSFQAHYGFEYVFCNAYAGHEKGGVESRVGAVRRKLFVPVPSVRGACRRSTPGCLNGASRWATRTTTAREGRETDLFAEDRKALLALPETRFDVVTWKRMKADKYGIVTVEGQAPVRGRPRACGGAEPVVRGCARSRFGPPRCLRGPHHDASARPTATTPPAASGPSLQIGLPWRQARGPGPTARSERRLPDPLREWLDGQARAVLAEGLRTLRQAERESGWGERGGGDG